MMTFIVLDLMPLIAAILVAINCALLGNFLLLRKQSLMGDAISHAVLPGIVVSFLITSSRDPLPMFIGATIAALLTTMLIEIIRRATRVNGAAVMGVVFSIMFALGVWLLEVSGAKSVDLDASCVLYGLLQDIIWLEPSSSADLLKPSMWLTIPVQVKTLLTLTIIVFCTIFYFYRQFVITSFDQNYADSIGIPSARFHALLMMLVAMVSVAAFEAVGSILVIAMLICPAAIARLLTQELGTQISLSLALGLVAAVVGYFMAATAPKWLGVERAVSAPGMIVVILGLILLIIIMLKRNFDKLTVTSQ